METLSTKIVDIIYAAAIKIKEQVTKKRLIVSTKSSRSDFVTNVDTQIQDFIMEELLRVERGIKFLAEENNLSSLPDFSGKVNYQPLHHKYSPIFLHDYHRLQP